MEIGGKPMEISSSDLLSALYPVLRLLNPNDQFYIYTFFGAAAVVATYYFYSRRGKRSTVRGLVKYMFPRKLMRHPSTVLDLKLYVFGSLFLVIQATLIFTGAPIVKDAIMALLTSSFGPGAGETGQPPIVALGIAITLLDFLAIELGYWYAHYLMHRVPFLWEFHKVHHSAEVMTPLTEWRQHPVELVLFPILISATTGVVHGSAEWYYGSAAQVFKLWQVNALIMVFWYTMLHLRHSHIKMSASGILAYLIQTPAHHHIHHSVEKRHYDKNLGYSLSLWDWVFGTLYLPEKDQKIKFGLAEEDKELETFSGSLVAPMTRAGRMLAEGATAHARRAKPDGKTISAAD